MSKIEFRELEGRSLAYWGLLGLLAAGVAVGLGAAYYMEHQGHWVTGMSNQIVWGTPHVFAVFLIVAASGALNVASVGTVFGQSLYKPLGRLSGLLAIALLVGGLAILVLDLGRPDRLVVAMTTYNFKSIFAWNIFLYTGFIVITAGYLWMMMEQRKTRFARPMGFVAFIWRLMLTTGTGCIFGFLVARQAYDAAIMAPMFVIMSFSFGMAFFILVTMAVYSWSGRPLGNAVLFRLKNLLGVFAGAVLYFAVVFHLTGLYATEHHGVERFILLDGGIYTNLFWIGHVLLGNLLPIALLYHPATGRSRSGIVVASLLVLLGGLAQIYVIIIGGQAYPLVLFPGMEVSSSFYDGAVNSYAPSLPEVLLGVGGVAMALIMVALAVKFLRFLPLDLSDAALGESSAQTEAASGSARPATA
jgi:molybdopterin-containing oxidoreductase family membrane subunit